MGVRRPAPALSRPYLQLSLPPDLITPDSFTRAYGRLSAPKTERCHLYGEIDTIGAYKRATRHRWHLSDPANLHVYSSSFLEFRAMLPILPSRSLFCGDGARSGCRCAVLSRSSSSLASLFTPRASSRAPMTIPRCAHAACLSWRCARRHARHCARGCWVWVGYGGGSVARGGSLDWARGWSLYTNIYSVMYGVVRFCPNPRPGLLAE